MADFERFEFTVPGYTPETMPLDRLIEYLNQLIIILGNPTDLHLVGIEKSSTKPILAMPHHAAVKARQSAKETWGGGGSQRQRAAFLHIRRMVADDGGEPAVLTTQEATILKFDTIEMGADQEISALRQASSVSGELLRVGGDGEFDQILLKDFSGEIVSGCFASKDLAKKLASHLHDQVRLSGIASWYRDRQGKWDIRRMKVQSFDILDDTHLSDALRDVQSTITNWPDDVTEALLEMRKDQAA